jgi:hypothetical protein
MEIATAAKIAPIPRAARLNSGRLYFEILNFAMEPVSTTVMAAHPNGRSRNRLNFKSQG